MMVIPPVAWLSRSASAIAPSSKPTSRLTSSAGSSVEAAISGGAPLGSRLGHFYRGAGVTIYEGYGLTETTAGATLNITGSIKVGTVGKPIPGTSIKIAEDGEVLIKGRMMKPTLKASPKIAGLNLEI